MGETPFIADTASAIRRNILGYRIEWPDEDLPSISVDAKAVVSALLVPEQHRRHETPDNIVQHRFFSDGNYPGCERSPCSWSPLRCSGHGPEHNLTCYRSYCKKAGVGKTEDGDPWPCVGTTEPNNPIRDPREGKLFPLPWTWVV